MRMPESKTYPSYIVKIYLNVPVLTTDVIHLAIFLSVYIGLVNL